MGDYVRKLAKVAPEVLQPGERLLAATQVKESVAEKKDRERKEDELAAQRVVDVHFPRVGAIVALTSRRLIFWGQSSGMARPTRVIHEIPVSRVVRIDRVERKGRLLRGAPRSMKLTFLLDDGSILPAEAVAAGVNRKPLAEFLSTFDGLKSGT